MITLRPLLGHIFFCFLSTENHSDIGIIDTNSDTPQEIKKFQ